MGRPQVPPQGPYVEDLLPRGYLALLAGKPKAGKTNLAATLAHAVSQGRPFAGMSTVRAPRPLLRRRGERRGVGALPLALPPARARRPLGGPSLPLRIDYEPDLWGLRMAVDHYKAGLIVVDPLLAAIGSGDFSSANRARNALTGLKSLCMDKGVAAIVVHHAKESRGLARRVAENPQLAATASLNAVLNHRPHCGKRLITLSLSLTGRGP